MAPEAAVLDGQSRRGDALGHALERPVALVGVAAVADLAQEAAVPVLQEQRGLGGARGASAMRRAEARPRRSPQEAMATPIARLSRRRRAMRALGSARRRPRTPLTGYSAGRSTTIRAPAPLPTTEASYIISALAGGWTKRSRRRRPRAEVEVVRARGQRVVVEAHGVVQERHVGRLQGLRAGGLRLGRGGREARVERLHARRQRHDDRDVVALPAGSPPGRAPPRRRPRRASASCPARVSGVRSGGAPFFTRSRLRATTKPAERGAAWLPSAAGT